MPTYTSKWVPEDGPTFYFTDPYILEVWDGDKFSKTIPSAQSQGAGEYAERSFADPRMVSIGGKVRGASVAEFQQRWQALTGTLGKDTFGKLYKDSDHYLICQCDSIQRNEDTGLDWCSWTATFRVSDPLFYAETLSSLSLNVSGSTALAIGGWYKLPLLITLNVSNIGSSSSSPGGLGSSSSNGGGGSSSSSTTGGGTITVTHTYNGDSESFTLTPTATGTVTIDAATGDILRGTTPIDSEFSGYFFEEVEPSGSSITITTSGGATLSAASATWRRQYPGV